MRPKFVKVARITHPINWWNRKGILGETFKVLDISPYNNVKIEYEEGMFGWVPLDACTINPL